MHSVSFRSFGKVVTHLLVPLALGVIPSSFVEAQSRHSLCLIKRAFGVECPGCGMTRAISCAFHGELGRAYRHNALVVIVLPLLGYLWLRSLLTTLRGALAAG